MFGRTGCKLLSALNNNRFNLINLKAVWNKMFHSPTVCHNFRVLRVSAPRPWYVFLHPSNDIDNKLACRVLNYGIPEGNTRLLTAKVFVIRWVHNIQCLFTAVLRWKTDIECVKELLFKVMCGWKLVSRNMAVRISLIILI